MTEPQMRDLFAAAQEIMTAIARVEREYLRRLQDSADRAILGATLREVVHAAHERLLEPIRARYGDTLALAAKEVAGRMLVVQADPDEGAA